MEDNADVESVYDIDEDALALKADENEYWASCYKFYKENKERKVAFLSQKQRDWLEKIQDGLSD